LTSASKEAVITELQGFTGPILPVFSERGEKHENETCLAVGYNCDVVPFRL
jgi:hypothetical protein